MNFSTCYFKESKATNLINVDIDELNFESVEKYIENNYQDESYENETKGMQNEKDILITQNNTLEAQEWHKLELLCERERAII